MRQHSSAASARTESVAIAVEHAREHFAVRLQRALAELRGHDGLLELERVVRAVHVELERHAVGSEGEAQHRAGSLAGEAGRNMAHGPEAHHDLRVARGERLARAQA